MAVVLAAVSLTACSNDEESVPLTVNALAGDFVGEATGTLVSINEKGEEHSQDVTPQGTETATIKVNEDGTVTLRQPTLWEKVPIRELSFIISQQLCLIT